jgi:hypothetical protein
MDDNNNDAGDDYLDVITAAAIRLDKQRSEAERVWASITGHAPDPREVERLLDLWWERMSLTDGSTD